MKPPSSPTNMNSPTSTPKYNPSNPNSKPPSNPSTTTPNNTSAAPATDAMKSAKNRGPLQKTGPRQAFQTAQDRDTYLTTQIEEVTQAMEGKNAFWNEQRDALANLRQTHRTSEGSLTTKPAKIAQKTKEGDAACN